MFKLLIFAAAGFILYKLFMGDKRRKEQEAPVNEGKLIADGTLVKDPICGTYVPKDGDIRVRDGEAIHCFCSYDCRDKFVKQIRAQASKEELNP